jgi:hypothetical protein
MQYKSLRGPGEAVDLGHQERVAFANMIKTASQFAAIRVNARAFFFEDPLAV